MNPIFSALNSGYSPEDILKYMSKAIPEIVEPIKKASRMGYNTQQILGYLSKSVTPRNTRGMSESQIHAQNRMEDNQRVKNGLSMAASAVAVPVAASAARSALSRALPLSLQNLTQSAQSINVPQAPGVGSQSSNIMPQQQQTLPQQNPSTNPSQPPVNPTNIQQQQALPQSQLNPIDARQILEKNNFIEKVDSLINSGNNGDAIDGFYRKFNPAAVKQIEKESGMPFIEVVNEYIRTKPKQNPPEKLPPESPGEEPPKPKYPPPPKGGGLLSRTAIEETFSKATPTTKGAIVDTPDGIGEVREIRNGKALVEVDGKMRKVLEEELMEPGLPQKDLADLHDELIEGIKTHTGKEVSRHVEWAGYDPEHKELIYKPWSGEQYTFDGIDAEDADMLTSLLTQRKTSGENYIGAWEQGTESPIGAAMHKLLTKLREKSKEAGKEKAHIRKYETVYSAYEPAQKASKEKKDAQRKKQRDEEKRRKSKEKQALKHSRSTVGVS